MATTPKQTGLRLVHCSDERRVAGAGDRAKLLTSAMKPAPPSRAKLPAPKTPAEWRARWREIEAAHGLVFVVVVGIVGDRWEAQDLTVDVIEEYALWERGRAAVTGCVPANPRPLLAGLARWRAVDAYRRIRLRREQPLDDDTIADLLSEGPSGDEADGAMVEKLDEFRAVDPHGDCADIIRARCYEDPTLTLHQIGEKFGDDAPGRTRAAIAAEGDRLVKRAAKCLREFLNERETER